MKDWIKENKITEVECLVPDLSGAVRGKIMPASKFIDSSSLRMPKGIFMQSVTGEYPDIYDELNPLDGDMVLAPDPKSMRLLPWAKDVSAQVIHDCYDKDGTPFGLAPRQVLKRILALYREEGWQPIVATGKTQAPVRPRVSNPRRDKDRAPDATPDVAKILSARRQRRS